MPIIITDKQIERFTDHFLTLESNRQLYGRHGQEDKARQGLTMLSDMLYTARFFGIDIPVIYKDGHYIRRE